MSQAFPSKYLTAADLDGKHPVVVMSGLSIEEVGQRKENKPILYFRGHKKGMVVNKTKANVISSVYGDETDKWMGKSIQLSPGRCLFEGKPTDCILVDIPRGEPPVVEEPDDANGNDVPDVELIDNESDDIPF